jgi:hypothetical protein
MHLQSLGALEAELARHGEAINSYWQAPRGL